MRIARALSASLLFFSPLFQGFLVFLFFRALLKSIKSTTWPALRPSFLSRGDKKKRKLKKRKNGGPSFPLCVRETRTGDADREN